MEASVRGAGDPPAEIDAAGELQDEPNSMASEYGMVCPVVGSAVSFLDMLLSFSKDIFSESEFALKGLSLEQRRASMLAVALMEFMSSADDGIVPETRLATEDAGGRTMVRSGAKRPGGVASWYIMGT